MTIKEDLYTRGIWTGRLLGCFLSGKATSEEEKEVRVWKGEHEEMADRLISMERMKKYVEWRKRVNVHEEWEKWKRRRKGGLRWVMWLRVAACLAAVAVGVWLWSVEREKSVMEVVDVVKPGSTKATLYVAGGEAIEFGDSVPEVLRADSTLLFSCRVLKHVDTKERIPEPLLLVVPKGGEFETVLADGTRIWLNADSRLRYPSVFEGEVREVELEGEAYFDVANDTARPFLVRTKQAVVQVFGTEFNVKAYPDDEEERMTLVEGSIGLRRGERTYMLRPDEQAIVKTGKEVKVKAVDARKQGLWRTGMFVFERETLESIMGQLARWYDVTVFFSSEQLKGLHFSGELDRYGDIGQVLRMIELTTDVSFSVQGRTVVVSSAR